MNEAIRMQLSVFADGELPDNEKELLLRRLSQDPEMRRQVAEYLAIGRAMRGEPQIPGIADLRDRIAGAIGTLAAHADEEPPAAQAIEAQPRRRFLKPAAGLATAAAVALIAIVGMQRLVGVPEAPVAAPTVADDASFSTQPSPDELLDQYRLMHEAEASDNSMRTRFTSIELRRGLAVEGSAAPPATLLPGEVPLPVDEVGDKNDNSPDPNDQTAGTE